MQNQSTKKFYNELAIDYHLIFNDWDVTINEQAKILNKVIQENSILDSKSLLDCSCGIGTQAIGLAQYDYLVTGTDLSPKAIERAKEEAEKRNIDIKYGVADFMKLESQVEGIFDIVISCDNSLPHLLTDEELFVASKNILSKMKSNGLFIGSIRDYDQLLEEKPMSTKPNIKGSEKNRTISFQVWDWNDDNTYLVNHFTIKGDENNYETFHRKSQYRAYKSEEMTALFERAGFSKIKWLMPFESGYYQPIILAYKL
jgi:glycine/sarcosine N-methyltransferase